MQNIEKVHLFYNVLHNNRFCEIEVLGKEVTDGEKCGSNRIKIVREIVGKELRALKGLNNGNAGLFNTGNSNSGDSNSGNSNSGDWNTGNSNSGDFNSCNYSSGIFCNQPQKIKIFNIDTEYTHEEFYDSDWWQALTSCSFNLTYMDNDELKTRTYKEACAVWWESMTDENKEIIKTIPNFSWEVFTDITGIVEQED